MQGIDIFKGMVGLHEVRDNKAIRTFLKKYSKIGDLDINPATTPWCAASIGAAERAVGNKGTGLLNARSYLRYGSPIELKDAKRGDILIFSRGGSTWMGHVAYYDGMHDKNIIRTLGGNQNDSICYSYYPKDRLIGVRRPPSSTR